MHVVVIKYMQLLCITVFFTNNAGCNQMVLPNEGENRQFYMIASCMAQCVRDDPIKEFEACYQMCNENEQIFTQKLVNITNSNVYVRPICRDDTSLVIKIENLLETAPIKFDSNNSALVEYDGGNEKHSKKFKRSSSVGYYENESDIKIMNEVFENDENRVFIYLINVQASNDPMDGKTIYLTNSSIFRIDKLMSNKKYNITVTVTTSNYEFAYANATLQYSTLRQNYTPKVIQNINVERYELNKYNRKLLNAHIVWTPAEDMTCHCDILSYSPLQSASFGHFEIRKPENLYTYTMENLNFGVNYSIAVQGKNTKYSGIESKIKWVSIVTPSCLSWFEYDLNLCAPPPPKTIYAVETYLSEYNYDVNISWDKPALHLLPSYYLIKIDDMSLSSFHEPFSDSINVTGNATECRFKNVELSGMQYDITMTAFSPGGNSSIVVSRLIDRSVLATSNDKQRILKIILAVIAPIILLAMIFLIIILICHRRAKLKRYEERCRYFEELEQKAPIDPNSNFNLKAKNIIDLNELETVLQSDIIDCTLFINDNDNMEIPRETIKILGILGEGAFGLVKKGVLMQENGVEREVAVKMLKDKPSADDYIEFRREIVVMKSVGRHQNIVGIIGHCTRNKWEMMLLTEYCCKGNLLNYLRSEWQRLSQKCCMSTKSPSQLIQALYNHNSDQEAQNNKNTISDSDCHTPSLASQKTPESVFNFDTSFVDKSFKYKNVTDDAPIDINDTDDHDLTTAIPEMDGIQSLQLATSIGQHLNYLNGIPANNNEFNTTNLIINKLYDEYTIDNTKCTNSCKCNVEIYNCNSNNINNNADNNNPSNNNNDGEFCSNLKINYSTIDQTCSDSTATNDTKKTKIKIKDCECYMNSCSNNNNNNNNSIHSNNSNNLDHNKKLNKLLKNYCDKSNNSGSKSQLLCDNSNGTSNNSDSNNSNGNQIFYSNSHINNNNNNDEERNHLADRFEIMNNKWNDQYDFITSEDLMSFAKQICKGMEFLSKNKVVHRDLAARNVLVAADKTVKIADFGLSRDIYQDNIYKKTGNGKLPIKWLALESMTHQIYTSQSDVWSYGILLYEIVTLGGNPYPSIPTNRLLKLLKAGYRMKKPVNCSQEIYNLMYSCWSANPQSRPTFSEILDRLDQQDRDFVNLELSEKQRSRSSKSSAESYLKPI